MSGLQRVRWGRPTRESQQHLLETSSTDDRGIVDAKTRLYFAQKGARVFARYGGGSVTRGCLVGTLSGSELVFRYTQLEASGQNHGGRSICEVRRTAQTGLRVIERFTWSACSDSGINIFDEIR